MNIWESESSAMKSFKCQFCKKGHLSGYEHTHTGERPFICKFSEKRFSAKKSSYTGQNP